MAVITIEPGDLEIQIKDICRRNVASLIADKVLDVADYPEIKGGLVEFREIMNDVFDQFNTDLTVAGLVTIEGESWRELRDKLNTNFVAVDTDV